MKKQRVPWGGLGIIAGSVLGFVLNELRYKKKKQINESDKKIESVNKRTAYYYDFLLFWMKAKREGLDLRKYFAEQGYHKIVLYGAGKLCVQFYEEIKDLDIDILYIVDKGNEKRFEEVEIINPQDVKDMEQPELVIITPIYDDKEIRQEISKLFQCPIVSMEDIIYAE